MLKVNRPRLLQAPTGPPLRPRRAAHRGCVSGFHAHKDGYIGACARERARSLSRTRSLLCFCVCMWRCVYALTDVCIHVCEHVRVHVCMHAHIRTDTFPQTYTNKCVTIAQTLACLHACMHARPHLSGARSCERWFFHIVSVFDASFHEIDDGRVSEASSRSFDCYLPPSREHGSVMGDVAKILCLTTSPHPMPGAPEQPRCPPSGAPEQSRCPPCT
jgi:hypothetical protein